jgi:hypothetical protein
MFIKVDKPKLTSAGSNKGSSAMLINYLDKENKGKSPEEKEQFFNLDSNQLNKAEAMLLIDSNNNRLSKDDAKYYMFSINPSSSELTHLEKLVEKEVGVAFNPSNKAHIKSFDNKLKEYANNVMDIYAGSFNRSDHKGDKIELKGSDFVYVAKLEKNRTFKHWETPVKKNNELKTEIEALKQLYSNSNNTALKTAYSAKIQQLEKQFIRQDEKGILQTERGEIVNTDSNKLGKNHHIHVVVSRQTKSQYFKGELVIDNNGKHLTQDKDKINGARPMKLSPLANGKGDSTKHKLNGKKVEIGFNNQNFKAKAGEKFNDMFDYKSVENDQYQYQNKSNVKRKGNENYSDKNNPNGDKAGNKSNLNSVVSGKIKSAANEHLRGEVLKNEEKIIKTVTDPLTAVQSNLKQKVMDILKGEDLVK